MTTEILLATHAPVIRRKNGPRGEKATRLDLHIGADAAARLDAAALSLRLRPSEIARSILEDGLSRLVIAEAA